MALHTLDLWSLVMDRPQIDPFDLAEAIVGQASEEPLDYRTRMLIKDSLEALERHWGATVASAWLEACPLGAKLQRIRDEAFDKVGFPSLMRRVMDKTKPEKIRQFLEHLGGKIRQPVTLYVAGSVALILPGYIARRTEDIDVVGEVPKEIREDHQLLHTLEASYNLTLGHVQTHYFPMRWESRAHSFGTFGRMKVYLLDVHDVFLSKLFSARLKDQEDLRILAPQLDKNNLIEKLKTDAASFLAAPRLLELAQNNWQILYGEPLPS